MRTVFVMLSCSALLGACRQPTPAKTVLFDWEDPPQAGQPVPVSKQPKKIVKSIGEWPAAEGPVKISVETEVGDLASDVHWDWPKHIHFELAEPTTAKLPKVDCMSAPPGNSVVDGKLVRPTGRDGVTPIGKVSCFLVGGDGVAGYAFEIDGDGQLKRVAVPQSH